VFRVYADGSEGRLVLWRCQWTNGHFLSVSETCEGHKVLGPLGYVRTSPAPGQKPLCRFTDPNGITQFASFEKDVLLAKKFMLVRGIG
jgi:hypothetical protein